MMRKLVIGILALVLGFASTLIVYDHTVYVASQDLSTLPRTLDNHCGVIYNIPTVIRGGAPISHDRQIVEHSINCDTPTLSNWTYTQQFIQTWQFYVNWLLLTVIWLGLEFIIAKLYAYNRH